MLLIKEISYEEVKMCSDFDSRTISLWSKKQWANELKKKGIKVFKLSLSDFVIGIYVFQVVLDEAQINFFAIDNKNRRRGFGKYLMKHLIKECEKLKIKKIFLEVSMDNYAAENFYKHFDFRTTGIRKNFYRDGSDALLKEKKLKKYN